MMRRVIHFALCLLVGAFSGGILLLDLPLKWKMVFLATLGTTVLMLMAGNSRRILIFVLAFTVPIYFGKGLIVRSGSFSLANGVGINLSDVLAMTLLFLFLAKLARRQVNIRLFPLITIPALVWLVFSSFSLLTARDVELAVFQLINMGKLLLLYWIIANSVGDEVDVSWVIAGLMLGMLFQASVGIYQGVPGHPLGLYFLDETTSVKQQDLSEGLANRVQGTIGHPNSYAMYVTTVIPFALALLFSKTRPVFKVLAGITLCLGFLALVYSLSRSAWINFLAIISIVLTLAVRRKRISSQAAVLIAGTSLLILLGVTLFGPDIILSRLKSSDQGSAYSRITMARTALAIIEDHPLVGVGLNNYTLVNPQYDKTTFVNQAVVHNAYLFIAAETGLAGLTAFLGFLAILLIQAWRIVNQATDDTAWVAGVGSFSAFSALAVHSMADYALLGSSQTLTQFWLLAGLSAALIQRMDCEQQDVRRVSCRSNAISRGFTHTRRQDTTNG